MSMNKNMNMINHDKLTNAEELKRPSASKVVGRVEVSSLPNSSMKSMRSISKSPSERSYK